MDFADVEEVLLRHTLEHIPYGDVVPTLTRIHSWMKPGAKITIEVPDMRVIAPEVDQPLWQTFIYGLQAHPGEFHRCGFTETTLEGVMKLAGFEEIEIEKFIAQDPDRLKMPVLEAVAHA